MEIKKLLIIPILFASLLTCGCNYSNINTNKENDKLLLHFGFDEINNEYTIEDVSKKNYHVNYVFNEENANKIFKEPSQALLKKGVINNSLYMDGFSTYLKDDEFITPKTAVTLSSWIAPRVFENVSNYSNESIASNHTRLTSIFNQGDMEMGEGFTFGYGRLGLWGIQLNLYNKDKDETFFVGYYDPLNTLNLYEWSFITATFDSSTGYIGLFFNGNASYEAIIPELIGSNIISSSEPLYIGKYNNPMVEFGISRQLPAGLLDEVSIYSKSLSPKEIKELYSLGLKDNVHPYLDFNEIALDSSQYEGDRYRPQYHALPPATWMNEPHSPIYYKGKYHVFYQHNPSGPYWSQIRWGHLVSDDMIHWQYLKDAVVPTKDICPEGVWTGGSCIGPDGEPWLVITAGTNHSTWSGQNIAYAHPKDINDPYLTDWVIESSVVIEQPNDDSQGERDQFRDPFIWYDDGTYYMLISTSIPGRGGSANVYTSSNMRNWDYKGYLYECPLDLYPEQGAHWECVVLLPISTKDKTKTKYILFDCPQYTVDGFTVDCYYWIGNFDKDTCRFIPDDNKPRLFDLGRGVYTGQNGYCFLTDEDKENGINNYEDGRTVIYAIAQGKDAGTNQNYYEGWAHNFAIPLELYLSDDGNEVIREPIKEIESLYDGILYESNAPKGVHEINNDISSIRGDMLRIDMQISIDSTSGNYKSGLDVRYNKHITSNGETEKTSLVFDQDGVYVDRLQSTLHEYVNKQPSYIWNNVSSKYDVTILLDRSMLEIYVNGIISFTTRIYPKYGDSDYLHFFEENSSLTINSLKIIKMKGAYNDNVTPSYYGNVGNLEDLL